MPAAAFAVTRRSSCLFLVWRHLISIFFMIRNGMQLESRMRVSFSLVASEYVGEKSFLVGVCEGGSGKRTEKSMLRLLAIEKAAPHMIFSRIAELMYVRSSYHLGSPMSREV